MGLQANLCSVMSLRTFLSFILFYFKLGMQVIYPLHSSLQMSPAGHLDHYLKAIAL